MIYGYGRGFKPGDKVRFKGATNTGPYTVKYYQPVFNDDNLVWLVEMPGRAWPEDWFIFVRQPKPLTGKEPFQPGHKVQLKMKYRGCGLRKGVTYTVLNYDSEKRMEAVLLMDDNGNESWHPAKRFIHAGNKQKHSQE